MWKAAHVNLETYCVVPALYKISAPSLHVWLWPVQSGGIFFSFPSSLFLIRRGYPSSQITFQKTETWKEHPTSSNSFFISVTSLCRGCIHRPAEPDLSMKPASVLKLPPKQQALFVCNVYQTCVFSLAAKCRAPLFSCDLIFHLWLILQEKYWRWPQMFDITVALCFAW